MSKSISVYHEEVHAKLKEIAKQYPNNVIPTSEVNYHVSFVRTPKNKRRALFKELQDLGLVMIHRSRGIEIL